MPTRPASERLAALQGCGPTKEELTAAVRRGDSVIGEANLPGGDRLDFEASNIRSERTGIHARVSIQSGNGELGYDSFNIEKNADRVRLANAAAERLGDKKRWGEAIRLRLDQFCSLVWPRWCQADAPQSVTGSDGSATKVLLHPYVTDSRTILYAPGGAGKSWLALIWALSLQYGLQDPWRTSGAVRTLYLDFEDTLDVFRSRLRQAAAVLDCPDELPYYCAEGRGITEVWDALRGYLLENPMGMLVIDSVSRLGLGKLTEDASANQGVNLMNRLGVPWLALAHTPHHSDENIFGSVHWANGARVTIRGEASESPKDEGLIGLRLSVTKANHIKRGQSTTWAMRFSGDKLIEHRQAEPGDFPDLGDSRPIRERIREYLTVVGEAPVEEICEWTEGSDRTVRRVLLDGEGSDFQRIGGGRGRGNKAVWRRWQVG